MGKLWIILSLIVLTLFFVPLLFIEKHRELVTVDKQVELCPIEITVESLEEPLQLEDYVLGVVAAEMPVTFHDEALKAQAIAARTYALRATDNGNNPIAKGVSAQVYSTEEERKERWGKEFKSNERKVRAAVKATAGDIVVYNDELISAMFFSTSNGKTETAQNFSGSDIPYLQSVESLGEVDVAPSFEEKTTYSLEEWNKLLKREWQADMFKSLQLVRNSTGRVQKVKTTGFELTGREMRELLNLRSTDFDIAFDITNNIVIVKTIGYGHGVGMSQYGAEAFAQEGWSAEDIILHYYTGTKIKKFTNNDSKCLKVSSFANNSK